MNSPYFVSLSFFVFLLLANGGASFGGNHLIIVSSSKEVSRFIKTEIGKNQIMTRNRFTVISDKMRLSEGDLRQLESIYKKKFNLYQLCCSISTKMRMSIIRNNDGDSNDIVVPQKIPGSDRIKYLLQKNGFLISNSSNSKYHMMLDSSDIVGDSITFPFLPEFISLFIFRDSQTNCHNQIAETSFDFGFISICALIIYLIIFYFRIKYILTKLNDGNFWFVTTSGSLLSKPTNSYYKVIKGFMRSFKHENRPIIGYIGSKSTQVFRFKFIRVCSYAYLVVFHYEEPMDDDFADLEMSGGKYRGYDMIEPQPIICRTEVDPDSGARVLKIDLKIENSNCYFLCKPTQKCLLFGHHCQHAQYVHRIYIGVLFDLLQIQSEQDFGKCIENIMDRLNFSGCGFFSVEENHITTNLLKYHDEASKSALLSFVSRMYNAESAIEAVTLTIGLFKVFGNSVRIGKTHYILSFTLPRNLLTIRFSERQFQGFFALVLAFHQLMNENKNYFSVKRIEAMFSKSSLMTFYEFGNSSEIIKIVGRDIFSPQNSNYSGFVRKNDQWFFTKNISDFDKVYDCQISLLYVESIINYFADVVQLKEILPKEIKTFLMFNFEFTQETINSHLCESLGYTEKQQSLFSLVHPNARKLLKLRRDVMNAPIRMRDSEGEYRYYIVPIVHSHNYAFIEFSDFTSILSKNSGNISKKCSHFPNIESGIFAFWCIDPLTDRIVAITGSPSIISRFKANKVSEIVDLVEEDDRQLFTSTINSLLVTQNNTAQLTLHFKINGTVRFFDVIIGLTSGYLLTVLAHDVTENKKVLDSAAEINQLIDIGLLYSNVLIWFFNDNHAKNNSKSNNNINISINLNNESNINNNNNNNFNGNNNSNNNYDNENNENSNINNNDNNSSNNNDNEEELVYSSMPIAHKPFMMNWSTIEFNVVLEDQSSLTSQIRAALDASSNTVDIEIPVMFDKIRWYMMRGMRSNRENQLMGILVDTTELKSLSAQAKQQKQRAEEANSAKSRFLANMSHEIRTPLSGMSGLLELLEGTSLPPDCTEIVACIRASFTKLLELLNDTLDLAKMDQKKMTPQKVNFRTFETLLPVISSFEQRATANHIDLHVIDEPGVPVVLSGDPHFLARITTNLISNSLKFTDVGHITVYFTYQNERLIIEVEDTGIGFLPEELSSIFEPFPMVNTTASSCANTSNLSNNAVLAEKSGYICRSSDRPPRGLGACLALVKRMVDALEGEIKLHSEVDKGTTFVVSLPFESMMSPYISKSLKTKRFQVMNLCPKLFHRNSFISHFVDFYGFEAVFENQSINLPKLKLIVCQLDELPKAMGYSKSAPNSKIILVARSPLDNVNEPNIVVFRMTEFWMRVHEFIPKNVLHSHEVEKVVIPDNFRILVADDNTMNQLIIKKLLEKMNKKFVVVGDGTEVIEVLKKDGNFNVIFMDHQMPQMDGPQTARTIRACKERFRDIPIIAMTASTLKEDEDECLDAGMNHFVSKPISVRKLEDEIIFAAGLPFNTNQM